MSKQESKMIKHTQEKKWQSEKKNLTENLQVSNEGMMQLAFKAIKYMGLEER